MKAVALFPGKRAVDIIDHPLPRIAGAAEAGTDREIATFQYSTPLEGFDYLIVGGIENVGEVAS